MVQDTSKQAFDSMGPNFPNLNEKVYSFIAGKGAEGATCDEIEVALQLRHQTASSRITHLTFIERLIRTETRRLTRSGRRAGVYIVKPGV